MTGPQSYVVDTHALLWFLSKDRKLGSRAKGILESATEILVPTIVMAEAVTVIEKRRVALSIDELLHSIEDASFVVVPFGADTFRAMLELPSGIELHDRMIAATAGMYDAAVLTRDPIFDGVVETVW